MKITSRANPRIKKLTALRRADERRAQGMTLAEGIHLVQEALKSNTPVACLILSDTGATHPEIADVQKKAKASNIEILELSDECYEKISTLRSPEGVAVTLKTASHSAEAILSTPQARVLIATGVQDPGNAGALVRVAEAAGCTGCILADGADVDGPKFLRAAMGSRFRLPCANATNEALLQCITGNRVRLCIADACDSAKDYRHLDWTSPIAICVGSEGLGVPLALRDAADVFVRIPMQKPVESLNVAVAAGILLYEARANWYTLSGTIEPSSEATS